MIGKHVGGGLKKAGRGVGNASEPPAWNPARTSVRTAHRRGRRPRVSAGRRHTRPDLQGRPQGRQRRQLVRPVHLAPPPRAGQGRPRGQGSRDHGRARGPRCREPRARRRVPHRRRRRLHQPSHRSGHRGADRRAPGRHGRVPGLQRQRVHRRRERARRVRGRRDPRRIHLPGRHAEHHRRADRTGIQLEPEGRIGRRRAGHRPVHAGHMGRPRTGWRRRRQGRHLEPARRDLEPGQLHVRPRLAGRDGQEIRKTGRRHAPADPRRLQRRPRQRPEIRHHTALHRDHELREADHRPGPKQIHPVGRRRLGATVGT